MLNLGKLILASVLLFLGVILANHGTDDSIRVVTPDTHGDDDSVVVTPDGHGIGHSVKPDTNGIGG
jgi:hypothetical protein